MLSNLSRLLPFALLALPLLGGCNRIDLPDDPQAVVIALRFDNGELQAKLPWHIQVHADGRVLVHDLTTGKKSQGKLSASELRQLLAFAIYDNDFFRCDPEQIKEALTAIHQKEDGPRVLVSDGNTSLIRVRANGKLHETAVYALKETADRYPEVATLTGLARIEERLCALARKFLEKIRPI